jgi:5-(carboxyamino)imidazole ribonucleotide synthase
MSVNKKIGIVGGGQLGKMMILEAKRLGFCVTVLDPAPDCPASSICDELIVSGFDDDAGYDALAEKSDVITYEFEHINASALKRLEQNGHTVYPSVASLRTIQNKFVQKSILHENGVAVPAFEQADSVSDIRDFADRYGFPVMLKCATGGYDGKGNALITDESGINAAFVLLSDNGKNVLMTEEFVDFDIEVSVIACRGIGGKKVVYPVAENAHVNSILDTTTVPARISREVSEKARTTAEKVMEVFEGVGTFCVELFISKDGTVLVNEVAPRPHNSGHYTIEGCVTGQFENHIRAITGLPLGSPTLLTPSVMVNLLGESDGTAVLSGVEEAYDFDENVKVHFYAKRESRKGRKMGHFTVINADLSKAIANAEYIKKIVKVTGV